MATLGGILLIIASILMFLGRIYYATIFYLTADIVWVYLGFISGNIIGTLLILIGFILNIGVFLKIHKGVFIKNLKKTP